MLTQKDNDPHRFRHYYSFPKDFITEYQCHECTASFYMEDKQAFRLKLKGTPAKCPVCGEEAPISVSGCVSFEQIDKEEEALTVDATNPGIFFIDTDFLLLAGSAHDPVEREKLRSKVAGNISDTLKYSSPDD